VARYTCNDCGNNESFTSLGQIDAVAKIDGDGRFVEWIEMDKNPTMGDFEEPYACEVCGSEDIKDEDYD